MAGRNYDREKNCCKENITFRRREAMNIGVETEKIEFKKTTGELREGITSLV